MLLKIILTLPTRIGKNRNDIMGTKMAAASAMIVARFSVATSVTTSQTSLGASPVTSSAVPSPTAAAAEGDKYFVQHNT